MDEYIPGTQDGVPIRPDQIPVRIVIPQVVFNAVNALLLREYKIHYKRTTVTITVDEVIEEIMKYDNYPPRDEIFKQHMLDFEQAYIDAGWGCVFHKRPYYETDSDYRVFTRPDPNIDDHTVIG